MPLFATAGNYLNAGLPDIRGWIDAWSNLNGGQGGAFSKENPIGSPSFQDDGGSQRFTTILFRASDSNSIYNASDTVQPNALTTRFYIKY